MSHSSSYQLIPPTMSELRVVLLGNCWSERSFVGNFILRETKFKSEITRFNFESRTSETVFTFRLFPILLQIHVTLR